MTIGGSWPGPPAPPGTPEGSAPTSRPTTYGRPCRVRRRYLPWHSRTREMTRKAWGLVPTDSVDSDGIIGIVFAIILIPFLIPALLVTPFFLVETLLQLLAAPFALILRACGAMDTELVKRSRLTTYETRRIHGWSAASVERGRWQDEVDACAAREKEYLAWEHQNRR